MKLSHSHKSHNKINLYKLDGYSDVFLYRNEHKVKTEDGVQYVADEVYLRLDKDIDIKEIEDDFEYYWNLGSQKNLTQEDYLLDLEFRLSKIELGL